MAETIREHYSSSQFNTFMLCPERFRRQYIEDERSSANLPMLVGSGVHTGMELNYKQKIESHTDLPPSHVADAAVAGFDDRLLDEDKRLDDLDSCVARDQTAQLAQFAGAQVMPRHQPLLVEQEFRLQVPGVDKPILGYIDLATVDKTLVDTKTTARKKSQTEADHSTQLTLYHIAHKALTGEYPTKIVLDTIIKKRAAPEHVAIETSRNEQDVAALAYRVNVMLQSIGAGIFPGANPATDWQCSQKWCGFFSTCPFTASYRAET